MVLYQWYCLKCRQRVPDIPPIWRPRRRLVGGLDCLVAVWMLGASTRRSGDKTTRAGGDEHRRESASAPCTRAVAEHICTHIVRQALTWPSNVLIDGGSLGAGGTSQDSIGDAPEQPKPEKKKTAPPRLCLAIAGVWFPPRFCRR